MSNFAETIHEIYDCREKYIVIGLTGRTGSGCSTAASILSSQLENINFPTPKYDGDDLNEKRKYKLVHTYISKNWNPFYWIKIKDIITAFILENDFSDFCAFAVDTLTSPSQKTDKIKELLESSCELEYGELRKRIIGLNEINGASAPDEVYKFYFEDISSFSDKLKITLNELSQDNYTRIFQVVGDNIRSSGSAISSQYNPSKIFSIAKRVNDLIKVLRERARADNREVFVVIDTLRNPFEALYFRERYSAFYLMAINTQDETRRTRLLKQFNYNDVQIENLDKKEYSRKKGQSLFISQDIQKCYDLADIHISNPQLGESDFTFIKEQMAKFVSLIMHPGLIMPSAVERCMQIAHTAKLNSGCLSRQVGAVITDKFFSIKALGWNTSPRGQTPCSLRNVNDFLNHDDKEAFSDYENNNGKFRDLIKSKFEKIDSSDTAAKMKGRNLAYCFKDAYNCLEGDKNQVHTRSLHAEENAFLQITKYGGQGILGGFLFTTSSPCELCSKKAFQLGIKKIFFIDPYPGVANQHILAAGTESPSLELFSGAIGRAYHQLYEPIMPYKDELELMIGFKFSVLSRKDLQLENDELKTRVQELEELIRSVSQNGETTK